MTVGPHLLDSCSAASPAHTEDKAIQDTSLPLVRARRFATAEDEGIKVREAQQDTYGTEPFLFRTTYNLHSRKYGLVLICEVNEYCQKRKGRIYPMYSSSSH